MMAAPASAFRQSLTKHFLVEVQCRVVNRCPSLSLFSFFLSLIFSFFLSLSLSFSLSLSIYFLNLFLFLFFLNSLSLFLENVSRYLVGDQHWERLCCNFHIKHGTVFGILLLNSNLDKLAPVANTINILWSLITTRELTSKFLRCCIIPHRRIFTVILVKSFTLVILIKSACLLDHSVTCTLRDEFFF